MSSFIPHLAHLETLAPDLFRVIKPSSLITLEQAIKTAVGRWVILRSLYDRESDYYFALQESHFKVANWITFISEKNYQWQSITCHQFLFDECSERFSQKLKKILCQKYQLSSQDIQIALNQCPFRISEKTIRNHFTSLSNLESTPLLEKHKRGRYQLVSLKVVEDCLSRQSNSDITPSTLQTLGDEEMLDLAFIKQEMASIVELLSSEIQGQQRLFLHHDYIVPQILQENTVDNADHLKTNWKESQTSPIEIRYYSASLHQTQNYIIYPVCLYYYQRAYYLSAWGQYPYQSDSTPLQWYNFRLERITEFKKLSWNHPQLPFSLPDVEDKNPDFIQTEFTKAYGFDFYQPKAIALLKFDPDFAQRYIDNSFRHNTFERIDDTSEILDIISQEADGMIKHQLIDQVKQFSDYIYYLFTYRQNDNNVIMRLRSWSPNVEVLLPLDLRQRMREDMEKTYHFYQDSL